MVPIIAGLHGARAVGGRQAEDPAPRSEAEATLGQDAVVVRQHSPARAVNDESSRVRDVDLLSVVDLVLRAAAVQQPTKRGDVEVARHETLRHLLWADDRRSDDPGHPGWILLNGLAGLHLEALCRCRGRSKLEPRIWSRRGNDCSAGIDNLYCCEAQVSRGRSQHFFRRGRRADVADLTHGHPSQLRLALVDPIGDPDRGIRSRHGRPGFGLIDAGLHAPGRDHETEEDGERNRHEHDPRHQAQRVTVE